MGLVGAVFATLSAMPAPGLCNHAAGIEALRASASALSASRMARPSARADGLVPGGR